MNIGSLYTVKKYFWFLFSSKEPAVHAAGRSAGCHYDCMIVVNQAKWLRKNYNCNISVVEENTYIVLLEEDGKHKKVLTSDGRVGWIWIWTKEFNDSFEEVKAE